MQIPTQLKHKPVIVVEDYENVDGRKDGAGEAKGLSLGLAQWNDRGRLDISAKVWRYTGNKWSRQSEELPLHRALDVAILIADSSRYFRDEAYKYPEMRSKDDAKIDRIGLQGDAMTVSVCEANPQIDGDIRLFADVLGRDGELLGERFATLARILKDMGY